MEGMVKGEKLRRMTREDVCLPNQRGLEAAESFRSAKHI